MRLARETEREDVRLRVVECTCDDDCGTVLLFGSTHERLWLLLGLTDWDKLEDEIEGLFTLEGQHGSTRDVVDRGVALLGLTWGTLMRGSGICARQLQAFSDAPEWMFGVPLEELWQLRRCVFGNDLTRVPSALVALRAAYDAGGVQTPAAEGRS